MGGAFAREQKVLHLHIPRIFRNYDHYSGNGNLSLPVDDVAVVEVVQRLEYLAKENGSFRLFDATPIPCTVLVQ